MNIGLYCNWKVKPVSENEFYINSVHAKYIYAFLKKFDRLYLLSNVSSGAVDSSDTLIKDTRIVLIKLPEFTNYISALKFSFVIKDRIKELCKLVDYIYIRTPEPLCWLFSFYKRSQVVNYHFTSNPLEVILMQKNTFFASKYFKYILFLPEYFLSSVAACFNKATCNGPSVLKNTPFFLRNKLIVLVENTVTNDELNEKIYRERIWNGKFRIICVSRLQEGKGLAELICAFSNIPCKDNLELVIVGDGPLKQNLEDYAATLNTSNCITFLGHVKNGEPLNELYRKSHVLINSSLSETGPRVILEGMSEGCVCISTDVGFVRYVLKSEADLAQFIIKDDFNNQFEKYLSVILENKSVYNDLSLKSFNLAKKYSLDSFVDNLID